PNPQLDPGAARRDLRRSFKQPDAFLRPSPAGHARANLQHLLSGRFDLVHTAIISGFGERVSRVFILPRMRRMLLTFGFRRNPSTLKRRADVESGWLSR